VSPWAIKWPAKTQAGELIDSFEFIGIFSRKRHKKRLTNQSWLYMMRSTSSEEVTIPP
jgi:hypothetical protein